LVLSVVFRRLGTAAERSRAHRMLDAGGSVYRSPRLDGGVVWYGLYDLTAANGATPEAAAAAVSMSTRVLEVCAMVVPTGAAALRARLVRELTDAGRACGVQWVVAADAADFLRREGFAPVAARDLGLVELGPVAWWALEV
jgi:hypothetical protein